MSSNGATEGTTEGTIMRRKRNIIRAGGRHRIYRAAELPGLGNNVNNSYLEMLKVTSFTNFQELFFSDMADIGCF